MGLTVGCRHRVPRYQIHSRSVVGEYHERVATLESSHTSGEASDKQ